MNRERCDSSDDEGDEEDDDAPQLHPPPPLVPTAAGDDNKYMLVKVEKESWIWNYIYKLKNGPVKKNGRDYHYACKLCAETPRGKSNFSLALISLSKSSSSNGQSHNWSCLFEET